MRRKLSVFFLILGLFITSFFRCDCDKNVMRPHDAGKGKVVFSFEQADFGLKKTTAGVITSAIVTIKDLGGAVIYDTEELVLYNFGSEYVSRPLSMIEGSYQLTSFIIVDDVGSAMYVTPLESSKYAYLVSDPLPINFAVDEDVTTKVIPEVIESNVGTPEDFGYTTFSFEVKDTFEFLVSVFVYNGASENLKQTTADISIDGDGDTIYTGTIEAMTDTVRVHDGYTNYEVTISKNSYSDYVQDFTADSLKLHYDSSDLGPLMIVLE